MTTLHAIGSVPAGSASWFWWIFAITNIVLVATLVSGIGRAGTEKPIVVTRSGVRTGYPPYR